jgi:predicted HNH restriction endonuclease
MDERIGRVLRTIDDFERLAQFEENIRRQHAMTPEVEAALTTKAATLSHRIIADRTGLDLTQLTPAEERIVQAVAEYIGLMKRRGKDAPRTLMQLKRRGFIESAEVAVAKAKPTQGFQVLKEEDLEDLSYEQIILDHPDEFSQRAAWFARRTLGQENKTTKPPAKSSSVTQSHTEQLLDWLSERARRGNGKLEGFTNAEAAGVIGFSDMQRYGRAFGNIISRTDFACYRLGLPPLGLTADEPFDRAWNQRDRTWSFPVESMRRASKTCVWRAQDFSLIVKETRSLPGSAHDSWQKELTENEDNIREWAYGLESRKISTDTETVLATKNQSNPDWTREEHILALDLYIRVRNASYSDEHPDVILLSEALGKLAKLRGMSGGSTFRNPNGVSMKLSNFRRLDPTYTADGRVGLPSGSRVEEEVWRAFADEPNNLREAAAAIYAEIDGVEEDEVPEAREVPYWVFVCNPAKWAIDRFIDSGVTVDTWGVRPSDRLRFAPGQLGIVRVGVDRRSATARGDRSPLEAGIYALCEVESEAFPGIGANDKYWAEDAGREPGWPTVRLRYLRTYAGAPLTIERLRTERPNVSHLLLNGHQAASFPISAEDFQAVIELLGEDAERLPVSVPSAETSSRLAELEAKYQHASPEVKECLSKKVERGPIGAEVKKANGHKCQLCEALGREPRGFRKRNGDPYVEAHHVMPVSKKAVGVLSASNIMTLCANHHREMHYGGLEVAIMDDAFEVSINGTVVRLPKAVVEQ